MINKIRDVERFLSKIKKTPTCWEWIGTSVPSGYGIFHLGRIRGESRDIRRIILAHRASWKVFKGEIGESLYILHKCNNRKCVNPNHLYQGSQKENVQDEIDSGTFIFGSKHPLSKLQESDIQKIVDFSKNGLSQRKIASMFGVDQALIWRIIHRKSWPHVKH